MSVRWLASIVLFVAACSGGSGKSSTCSDGGLCALACGPGIDTPPLEGGTHVPEPTMVTYAANPPASGPHWPQWQEPWGPYPDGLPRERWVHNLEHGGVVLLYNCSTGCDDVVGALTTLYHSTPPDQYNEQRILIVPDSQMPHRAAAVAWGWRWQGDSVDSPTVRCFIDARYDRAPESIP
jgi:Protein of unknown function (DUF3105)